jgi:hypothetical protein
LPSRANASGAPPGNFRCRHGSPPNARDPPKCTSVKAVFCARPRTNLTTQSLRGERACILGCMWTQPCVWRYSTTSRRARARQYLGFVDQRAPRLRQHAHRGCGCLVALASAEEPRSQDERAREPPPFSEQEVEERVYLADLPLLPVQELSRKPERWERTGAYAVFDEERTLRYVGYTKNVLAKLQVHRKLQPSLCRYFKTYFPTRGSQEATPDFLESVLCDWIRENGRVPSGNYQLDRWESMPSPSSLSDTENDSPEYAPMGRDVPNERIGAQRAAPRGDEGGAVDRERRFGRYRTVRRAVFDEEGEADAFDEYEPASVANGDDWWHRLVRVFIRQSVPLPTGVLADESLRVRVRDKHGGVRSDRPLVSGIPAMPNEYDGPRGRRRGAEDRETAQNRDPYLEQLLRFEEEEAYRKASQGTRWRAGSSSGRRSAFRSKEAQAFPDEEDMVDDWNDALMDNGLQDWIPFLALGGLALFLYLVSALSSTGNALPPESLGF